VVVSATTVATAVPVARAEKNIPMPVQAAESNAGPLYSYPLSLRERVRVRAESAIAPDAG
jgi:hypothetical protein